MLYISKKVVFRLHYDLTRMFTHDIAFSLGKQKENDVEKSRVTKLINDTMKQLIDPLLLR